MDFFRPLCFSSEKLLMLNFFSPLIKKLPSNSYYSIKITLHRALFYNLNWNLFSEPWKFWEIFSNFFESVISANIYSKWLPGRKNNRPLALLIILWHELDEIFNIFPLLLLLTIKYHYLHSKSAMSEHSGRGIHSRLLRISEKRISEGKRFFKDTCRSFLNQWGWVKGRCCHLQLASKTLD